MNLCIIFLVFIVSASVKSQPLRPNERPIVNLDDYEEAAKRILPQNVFDYAAGGGFYELTLAKNRAALKSLTLWPRYMRDVSQIDTNLTVLGKRISFPIGISPTAYHKAWYPPEGEIATAKACETLGNIYVMSYYATTTIEAVAAAAPTRCRKWMDIYLSQDRETVQSVVERATHAGFEAILVTIDGVNIGRRYRNQHNSWDMDAAYPPANHRPNSANFTHDADPKVTWEDIRWLRNITTLPIVVKGVLHPLDVREAIRVGVSAVYVSNHGGRQLDTVSSTIEALPDVMAEVEDHYERTRTKVDVYTDGGYRTGVDLIKPFSYGVDYVFLGRPTVFMLAVNGSSGVINGFNLAYRELRDVMELTGFPTLADVSQDLLSKWSSASRHETRSCLEKCVN